MAAQAAYWRRHLAEAPRVGDVTQERLEFLCVTHSIAEIAKI